MKKLTCTLLAAMFTTTSMLFAQISSSGPVIVVSDYFTITNKTTKESKKVEFSKFTSDGNNSLAYDMDFCLGVYNGDEIEITYKPEISIAPQTTWSYSWNGGTSYNLGTAFTANLSVKDVPYNGSTLTFTCDYQNLGNSRSYNIRFKNVHKEKRIKVTPMPADDACVLAYEYYYEVLSCMEKAALASLYNYPSGTLISSKYFECIGDLGVAILSTGGASSYIVNVKVNNEIIFTRTISVK